jgi:hypothetical protein
MPVTRDKSSFWQFASPRRRWWPVVTVGAAILIAVSLISPAGRHQWALSVFRQPTRYTTLAFKYAWLLPARAKHYQRIPVFFTIGNQEGKALRYRYIMRQTDGHSTRQLSQASAVVAAGATWTVDTSVRPYCNFQPCRVEVLLPGHPEHIDFLVFLSGTAAGHQRAHSHHHKHKRRHHART